MATTITMPSTFVDDYSAASFSVTDHDHTKPASCLSKKGMPMRRRHSITFGEDNVFEIDRNDDVSHEEIWYSKEEYDIIKARNKLLVKMKKNGKFEESEEHSFRGLEHKLKEGSERRRSFKFDALNAVLEEQDRQYAKGLRDAENIAQRYQESVSAAQETAISTAQRDAEAAFDGKMILDMYNDDDASVVSDLCTLSSDDTTHKRLRLRSLFQGISHMKTRQSSRRASM
jgi:hypothetical protein